MLSDRNFTCIDQQIIDAEIWMTVNCSRTWCNYAHGSLVLNLTSKRLRAPVYVLNSLQDHQTMRSAMGQHLNY